MNDIKITDFGHHTGAIESGRDYRDYRFEDIAGSLPPFDWNQGYDIENLLNIKLIVKDQGQSFSCGGQAWSYYGEVLSTVFDKIYNPKSAKFIYEQTAIPGGGSSGRDNCGIVKNQGWANEAILSSYEQQKPPTEEYMTYKDINDMVRLNASLDKAISYAQTSTDIESIAQAINANYGCVIGIVGQNNGTWTDISPVATNISNGLSTWRHWLYCGKIKMVNGMKFIGVINSWGNAVGQGGWQWLGEEHFKGNIFEAWTIIFNPQKIDSSFKHVFNQDLSLGNQSDEVKSLQQALQVLGYFPTSLPPTGYYGEVTRKAVYQFQIDHLVAPIWILWFNQGRYCWSSTRKGLNKLFN